MVTADERNRQLLYGGTALKELIMPIIGGMNVFLCQFRQKYIL